MRVQRPSQQRFRQYQLGLKPRRELFSPSWSLAHSKRRAEGALLFARRLGGGRGLGDAERVARTALGAAVTFADSVKAAMAPGSNFHPLIDAKAAMASYDRDREFVAAGIDRDHCLGFRADGKNVAVVTQPYHYDRAHYDRPDDARAWFADRGLAVHIPPDPFASFHFPGETFFIVITKTGAGVKWLPEQDGRGKARWRA